MAINKLRLSDLFRYYRSGLPYQMAAISELEEAINNVDTLISDIDDGKYDGYIDDGDFYANDEEYGGES